MSNMGPSGLSPGIIFSFKELYRRVQEDFRQNNIEFAHRNVTIYFPPEVQSLVGSPGTPQAKAMTAAAGAAAAGVMAAEQEQAK